MSPSPFKLLITLLFLAALPLGFNACGEGFKGVPTFQSVAPSQFNLTCNEYHSQFSRDALVDSRETIKAKYCNVPAGNSGSQGKLSTAGLRSFAQNKVVYNSVNGVQSKITSDVIAGGSEWVAFVTPNCDGGALYRSIIDGYEFNEELRFNSIAFVNEADISAGEFQSLIGSDPCILGVSKKQNYSLSYVFEDEIASRGDMPHLDIIEAGTAYDMFFHVDHGIRLSTSEQALVGVIDSGIQTSHPDLAENIYVFTQPGGEQGFGYDVTASADDPDLYIAQDISGHGTHVAGIIGAVNNTEGVVGIAPRDLKILNLKAFLLNSNDQPVSQSGYIIEAIQVAICNDVDVLNMSLQGQSGTNPQDPMYEEILTDAVAAGMVLVSVTGNASAQNPQQELTDTGFNVLPGRYGRNLHGMITVAALNEVGNNLANFSFFSPTYAEIAAPGTNIWSSYVTVGTPFVGYSPRSGTSMAAPMVAGAATLIINILKTHGYYPTPDLVEDIIKSGIRRNGALDGRVLNSGQLNLVNIAREVHHRFPVTNGSSCPQ